MSLAVLADNLASRGRGGDSTLVHMNPEEVRALQTLAEKHGTSLTINPETGLPEALSLKSFLPAIAGAALNFFAPGVGTAIGSALGTSAAVGTGIAVGGISALATGSLSRGLMAGLGAYGGASLAGGLENLGATAVSPEALTAANASTDPIMAVANAKEAATAAGITPAVGAEAAKQGLATAVDNPKAFMNALGGPTKALSSAYMAATPIMADAMVPTTTSMPTTAQTPSYVRPYVFNPYTQEMRALKPIDASKIRLPEEKMADGGIVALADGGDPIEALYQQYAQRGSDPEGYKYWANQFGSSIDPNEVNIFKTAVAEARAQGTEPAAAASYTPFTASQINDYIANNNLDAAGIAAATKQFNVDPNAVINAQNAQETVANVYRNVLGRDPDPVGLAYWSNKVVSGQSTGQEMYNEFLKSASSALGTSGEREFFRPGISLEDAVKPFQGYSSADKRNIADEWVRNVLGREVTAADRQSDWYKQATSAETMSSYDRAQDIYKNFQQYARQASPDFKDLGLFQASQLLAPVTKQLQVLPASYTGGSATDGWTATTPATYAPEGTTNPYGNGITPGDITRNPDGSVTVQPNIPGRPYGGFTGIQQLKNAYTEGGGSLGQQNLFAPKSVDEMYQRYGTTGGSKQAYDYLMGKGAVDVKKPITKTGELMLPYAQAMGLTQRAWNVPKKPVKKEEETAAAPAENLMYGAANGGVMRMALGGLGALAGGGQAGYNLGSYSDGGRLLRGPGDGVSDSIPATIGDKQPARLADGEFVVPARIVSELGNGSTEAGARKLYAMMDRVQKARGKTTGKGKVAKDTGAEKYLPA